jgi:hypothetical protein
VPSLARGKLLADDVDRVDQALQGGRQLLACCRMLLARSEAVAVAAAAARSGHPDTLLQRSLLCPRRRFLLLLLVWRLRLWPAGQRRQRCRSRCCFCRCGSHLLLRRQPGLRGVLQQGADVPQQLLH